MAVDCSVSCAENLFCVALEQLDPFGALSLKYDGTFEVNQNALVLSIQKIEQGQYHITTQCAFYL